MLLLMNMVAFCTATTYATCSGCCVSFLLFLLVVCLWFFLLVSLLLILLRHSFLSLDFWLFFFFLLFSFFFFAFYVLSTFSLFLLLLIFCLFFSPGPQVRLKRNTNETTTMWFSLPFGELCENVLCAKLLLVFSFSGFLVVHSTCIC